MKGETYGQFSIQQKQAKNSPSWYWRAFTFTAHHQHRKKKYIFFKFPEPVTEN